MTNLPLETPPAWLIAEIERQDRERREVESVVHLPLPERPSDEQK